MKLFILLSALVGFSSAITYTVKTQTASHKDAGTDKIGASLILSGEGGEVKTGILDNPGDDFEKGAIDTFTIESDIDIGQINCVTINVGKSDKWLFEWISVSSDINPVDRYVRNNESVWMSSDRKEGSKNLELCVPVVIYTVETKTGSRTYSYTINANVSLTLSGEGGEVNIGSLDNSFENGAIDTFTIESKIDIGLLDCVTIGFGQEDAWLFEWISVSSDVNPDADARFVNNTESVWMSTDISEGSENLELCVLEEDTMYL